ncbi:cytochrome P450 family protein [Streptomyces sp. JNUCC 64]
MAAAPTLADLAPVGTDPYLDPSPLHDALRRLGPVHRVRVPEAGDVWLVVGRDAARAALTDPALRNDVRHAANRPAGDIGALGRNMLQSDPPEHTALRARVARHFTPGRVEALRPRVRRIAADLVAALPRSGEADLVSAFAAPLPVTVICELLGVPEGDRDAVRSWTRDLLTPETEEARAVATGALAEHLGRLLAEKRDRPADDLLSTLAAPDAGEPLAPLDLLGMAFLLLVAGHETTVHLISSAVYALLCRPELLDAARRDPGLLDGVVEETLRFHSPASAAIFRYAAEDTRVGGTAVAKGETVLVSLAAAGRDPAGCPAPEVFDPRRGRSGHLGFGHGAHHCPGAPLARIEAVTALTELLAHRPALRLAVPPESVRWRPALTLRGLVELPVRFG